MPSALTQILPDVDSAITAGGVVVPTAAPVVIATVAVAAKAGDAPNAHAESNSPATKILIIREKSLLFAARKPWAMRLNGRGAGTFRNKYRKVTSATAA